jgi:hypothetical protein
MRRVRRNGEIRRREKRALKRRPRSLKIIEDPKERREVFPGGGKARKRNKGSVEKKKKKRRRKKKLEGAAETA